MDYLERLTEAVRALLIGGGGIAFITLTEVKDVVAIVVGIVTVVCLIYTTFFRKVRER